MKKDWFKGALEEALQEEGFFDNPFNDCILIKQGTRHDVFVGKDELRDFLRERCGDIEGLPRVIADDDRGAVTFGPSTWSKGVKPLLLRLLQ